MIIEEHDLVTLRHLVTRHNDLAAAYAEADPWDDLDRIYSRIRDLEQAITAEVSELFELYLRPMPKLRDLMSRQSPFEEDQ